MLLDHPDIRADAVTFGTEHTPAHFLQAQLDTQQYKSILEKLVKKGKK